MQISGVVERAETRPMTFGDGRQGAAYDLYVNGTKYGCGFKPTGANVGDTVSFDATQNGQYWNLAKNTPVTIGAAAQVVPQAVPQQGQVQSTLAVTSPPRQGPTDTQVAIQFQSSRKDAIEQVKTLLQYGAGGITDKTVASKRADIIDALTDEYTTTYFNRIIEVVENGGVEPSEEAQLAAVFDEEFANG
tara:strand:- start:491 stop:1060 length:570 start_codon:yes stop_codon:yes gene_type:complete